MTSVARTMPRVLAGLRRTCKHCRASTTELTDRAVGFSCCRGALEDQLRYRTDELERLRADAKREQDRVAELEAEARIASGYKVDEAVARADRARRSLERRLRDHYGPLADELKADAARARELLEALP